MKLKNIQAAIKNGLVLGAILIRLEKLGIVFNPYYIIEEREFHDQPSHENELFDACSINFLGKDEIDGVALIKNEVDAKKLLWRLEEGQLCFGLRKGDELVAYMWCDLKEFNFAPCLYNLKRNQAYLYDAQVKLEYRGKGLAPYFRAQVYSALKQYSKDAFFSYSDYANTPAIRFKKKLGARFLKLCLYVNLWNKFSRNWVLRDFYPER